MEYILKGDPAEVEKVIRENRIRVQRGVIQFIPVAPAGGSEAKPRKRTKKTKKRCL